MTEDLNDNKSTLGMIGSGNDLVPPDNKLLPEGWNHVDLLVL